MIALRDVAERTSGLHPSRSETRTPGAGSPVSAYTTVPAMLDGRSSAAVATPAEALRNEESRTIATAATRAAPRPVCLRTMPGG